MRISPIPFAAIATLFTVAACSGSRSYTWSDHTQSHQPVSTTGMTVLVVADDDALQAEVAGTEHRLTWTLNDMLPAGTSRDGFVVKLADKETISVALRGDETMATAAPIDPTAPEPWVRLSRGLGTLNIWHASNGANASSGLISLEFEPTAIATIRNAGWEPRGLDALRLILTETSADELVSFRRVDNDLSLRLACELTRHNADISQYGAFVKVTEFDDLEVTRLLRYGVSLGTTVKWFELGNHASVDDLIYCQQRNIGPDLAVDWRNVDAPLNFEEMYWAKQRGLRPEHHRAWLAVDNKLDLEELYWVRQRSITPELYREWADAGNALGLEQLVWARQHGLTAATWKQWSEAGKDLPLERLYWARTHGLSAKISRAWTDIGQDLGLEDLTQARMHGIKASTASEWRDLGYSLTIAELSNVRLHGVSPDFARRFLSPKFQLPTIDELRRYQLHGSKPADVNRLRKPFAPSGSR